jgi:hypothetical protein
MYDGAQVRIVEVYIKDNEERAACRLYHCNRGYAIARVLEFAKESVSNVM